MFSKSTYCQWGSLRVSKPKRIKLCGEMQVSFNSGGRAAAGAEGSSASPALRCLCRLLRRETRETGRAGGWEGSAEAVEEELFVVAADCSVVGEDLRNSLIF